MVACTGTGKLSDLSPLEGMPLTSLECTDTHGIRPVAAREAAHCKLTRLGISTIDTLRTWPKIDAVATIGELCRCRHAADEADATCTEYLNLSPLRTHRQRLVVGRRQTKVTAAGVAALQKALPNCKIEWDVAEQSQQPVNRPCQRPRLPALDESRRSPACREAGGSRQQEADGIESGV